jgi:hypothetical protein
MHCVHGEDSEKNQSAILVNNCAAVGGPSICMTMAMHSGLIGALKSLLLHGEEPQRSRAAGAFMLLSHSTSARKHLLRGGSRPRQQIFLSLLAHSVDRAWPSYPQQ